MTDLSKGEIKIYEQNGSIKVEVIMQDNSIWLSAEKIGELFDNKDRSTIQRHIKHIYEEDELSKDSTCAFFAQVQEEGTRNVTRNIPYYNLDVILAVGYRVSSKIATSFRKWATDILHQYVVNGYVINENLITASCFLYFMQKNNMLYINGKKRIDDDTLFAITLFIAESKSEDMEMFRQIIISILNRSM